MTTNTIVILIIGLFFSAIGFFASHFYQWKKFKTYIPIFIGFSLIYISTLGPLALGKTKIHQLTEINQNRIESIILQPTRNSSYRNLSILARDTIIADKRLISEVCKSLHKAKITGDGFLKNPQSVCRIQINMTDKTTVEFGVKKAGKATCLTVNSNGESGWHFANLDANDFGLLLDEILK